MRTCILTCVRIKRTILMQWTDLSRETIINYRAQRTIKQFWDYSKNGNRDDLQSDIEIIVMSQLLSIILINTLYIFYQNAKWITSFPHVSKCFKVTLNFLVTYLLKKLHEKNTLYSACICDVSFYIKTIKNKISLD